MFIKNIKIHNKKLQHKPGFTNYIDQIDIDSDDSTMEEINDEEFEEEISNKFSQCTISDYKINKKSVKSLFKTII